MAHRYVGSQYNAGAGLPVHKDIGVEPIPNCHWSRAHFLLARTIPAAHDGPLICLESSGRAFECNRLPGLGVLLRAIEDSFRACLLAGSCNVAAASVLS